MTKRMSAGKRQNPLGRLGSPGAVDALIDTLWDDDARVRLKAAWAPGRIGDVRGVPHFGRLYRIERDDARDTIREAFESISRKQILHENTSNAES
ncbi:MAG: hypothetical protein A4E35_00994 [Methanoregula sp. PtaU1.Bin051]|nr:MAG: hypothetical protein A4E35_00994 [Methanoregula sp. PtaU1.Bin051]